MALITGFKRSDIQPRYTAHVEARIMTSNDGKIFEICTYKEGDKDFIDKKQVIDIDKQMAIKIAKEIIKFFKLDEKDLL